MRLGKALARLFCGSEPEPQISSLAAELAQTARDNKYKIDQAEREYQAKIAVEVDHLITRARAEAEKGERYASFYLHNYEELRTYDVIKALKNRGLAASAHREGAKVYVNRVFISW